MLCEGAGSRLAGWLGLAAGFGLLGALCDQFHVQSGLLSYPDTWLWDQAAWVPLNFAVLLTGLVALAIPLGRLAAARGVPEPGPRRLAADFAWFVGAYALSGLVAPDAPGALAVTYFAVWVVRIVMARGHLPARRAAGTGRVAPGGCVRSARETGRGRLMPVSPPRAGRRGSRGARSRRGPRRAGGRSCPAAPRRRARSRPHRPDAGAW